MYLLVVIMCEYYAACAYILVLHMCANSFCLFRDLFILEISLICSTGKWILQRTIRLPMSYRLWGTAMPTRYIYIVRYTHIILHSQCPMLLHSYIDLDVCGHTNPCLKGTCHNVGSNNFVCECPTNYFGPKCEFYYEGTRIWALHSTQVTQYWFIQCL